MNDLFRCPTVFAFLALFAAVALPAQAQNAAEKSENVPFVLHLNEAGDLNAAAALLENFEGVASEEDLRRATQRLQARLDRLTGDETRLERFHAAYREAERLNEISGRPLRGASSRRAALRYAYRSMAAAGEKTSPTDDAPGRRGGDIPRTVSEVHAVPFASESNRVALRVEGAGGRPGEALTARAVEVPAWVTLRSKTTQAVSGADPTATFIFDIEDAAPVGQTASLVLRVYDSRGRALSEREVRLEVAAPERFALQGSYPNPFGPGGAVIAYDLPAPAEVRLEVYDVLGRRVAVLVDGEEQGAGRQTARFRGTGLASGLYLYRIRAGEHAATGQMMLVK